MAKKRNDSKHVSGMFVVGLIFLIFLGPPGLILFMMLAAIALLIGG